MGRGINSAEEWKDEEWNAKDCFDKFHESQDD